MTSLIIFVNFGGLWVKISGQKGCTIKGSGLSLAISAQTCFQLSVTAVPGHGLVPCDVGDTQTFAMYVPPVVDDDGLVVVAFEVSCQKNARVGFVLAGGQWHLSWEWS
ncbi:hypothetical protein MFRU_006g03740 [Monilinia fructicola]|nr:hypothetical protein MFRU_006g03740 [Monilinia fructicola]